MEKFPKIENDGQFKISFDNENEKKKTWRELVGEDIFIDKMHKSEIGPSLWEKVVIDDNGNILTVNGYSYEKWLEMTEKDNPSDMYEVKIPTKKVNKIVTKEGVKYKKGKKYIKGPLGLIDPNL